MEPHSSVSIRSINAMLTRNQNWYAETYPSKYRILYEIHKVFSQAFDQFPEAYCTDASKAIYHLIPNMFVMCGKFHIFNHNWIYDIEAKAHIDITAAQFFNIDPIMNRQVIIVKSKQNRMFELGYRLLDVNSFDQLFSTGPYNTFESITSPIDSGESIYDLIKDNEILLHALQSRLPPVQTPARQSRLPPVQNRQSRLQNLSKWWRR
jgi:hypothetical protein